ncbi:MAG: PIN domain-containing protein [Armatimonadetes bacterium]|nr:PIN domain-containing protein [Armatimonadota bacterium]
MIAVLDAGAVIAYLQGEPGAEVVAELLADPRAACTMHAVNVYEVIYDIWRRTDRGTAAAVRQALGAAGVTTRCDLDDPLLDDGARS